MKKAIIVGATSGIGRALAFILAEKGYKVGITGRREVILNEMVSQKPDSFISQAFDISDIKIVPNHLNDLANQLEDLDLLIISSGIAEFNPELNSENEQETIDTNVSGFA